MTSADSKRERILQDIDDWRAGRRATLGQPFTGLNYALTMRENVKRLEDELRTTPESDGRLNIIQHGTP